MYKRSYIYKYTLRVSRRQFVDGGDGVALEEDRAQRSTFVGFVDLLGVGQDEVHKLVEALDVAADLEVLVVVQPDLHTRLGLQMLEQHFLRA